jgi:small conductance mechanosensitive channel
MDIDFSQAVDQMQELLNDFIAAIPNIIVGVLVFVLFYYLARWVRHLVRTLSDRSGREPNIGLVLGRLSQWLVLLLGFLFAAVIVFPTFAPGQIIQLLGISSVAFGFAFRDILQNFLAGIIILWTQPFRIGDQIRVGEFEGTVEEIQTRATLLRTFDERRVVIPNADLFTSAVFVNTAFAERRIEYEIGIGYGDDIPTAKRLIVDAINTVSGVLETPAPDVIVVDLGAFDVKLRARWWVVSPAHYDALDTRDKVLIAIKDALTAHGIDLPFPTQQVLFHDQTEATDGDRSRQREGWPAGSSAVPGPRRPYK